MKALELDHLDGNKENVSNDFRTCPNNDIRSMVRQAFQDEIKQMQNSHNQGYNGFNNYKNNSRNRNNHNNNNGNNYNENNYPANNN